MNTPMILPGLEGYAVKRRALTSLSSSRNQMQMHYFRRYQQRCLGDMRRNTSSLVNAAS